MNRPYLIFVNNVLADRKLTFRAAKKVMDALKAKGYTQVSVAYEKKGN